jgi:hypothetical protein
MTISAPAAGTITFNTTTGFWTITPGIAGTGTGTNSGLCTPYFGTPGNPSSYATAANTWVMMGLGGVWTVTPAITGRVRLHLFGNLNITTNYTASVQLAYGTGAAPANAAAATGTVVGNKLQFTSITTLTAIPFHLIAPVTGLTPGTAVWFDAQVQTNSTLGTVSLTNLTAFAEEMW